MWLRSLALLSALHLLPAFVALGDVIHLTNGKQLAGQITAGPTDTVADAVTLRMHRVSLTIARERIERIAWEDNAGDYYRLFLQAEEAEHVAEALRYIEEALATAPEHPDYLAARTRVESRRQLRNARTDLEEIRVLLEEEHYREAVRRAEALRDHAPGGVLADEIRAILSDAYAGYAFHLYNHFAEDAAMEYLLRARELAQGDTPAIHLALARIAFIDQNFEAALDEYELAAVKTPDLEQAKRQIVELLEPEPEPPVPQPAGKRKFDDFVQAAARRHRLSPELIHRIILLESSGRPEARSTADARGLMQIRQAAWNDMTARLNTDWDFDKHAYDPEKNIQVGAAYLAWLRDDFFPRYRDQLDGISTEDLLLQGYHAGPNRTVYYSGKVPGRRTRQYLERYEDLASADEEQGRQQEP